MRHHSWIIFFLLLVLSFPVFADEEAPSFPYVKSSKYGGFYVKSVPGEYDVDNRTQGKTYVYAVRKKEDKLQYTFDWFAPEIYLLDNSGSMIRLGSWSRGHESNKDDLAIAFYICGAKVKEYSTLDIVNMAYDDSMNIGLSVSHYTVFEEIIGYRWLRNDRWAFDVKTHEGKILSFDISTGDLRTEQDEIHDKIIGQIQDLKVRCYEKLSQDDEENEYARVLTVEEFKNCVGEDFPQIPEGYQLYIGSFFEEVKLEKKD